MKRSDIQGPAAPAPPRVRSRHRRRMYSFGGVRRMLPLLIAALAAVAPASASAPVSLVFDRSTATPHTLVVGKTAGKGALRRVRKRPLRVYLQDHPLVPLGRLSVNRKGNGTLRFNVPNVPPGKYNALLRGLPGRPALRVVGSFRVLDGPAMRTCEQSVYGVLGDDWRSRNPSVGPVHLIGYDPAKASDPSWDVLRPDRTTGQYAIKVLLVIDRGPPVTISVAPEDRKLIALTYIPFRFNLHRVTEGDASVTFEPCGKDASTQFNGGFVFVRPLCAHFELRVEGRPDAIAFALPFGKPCSTLPAWARSDSDSRAKERTRGG
jgi:hypothetical protein